MLNILILKQQTLKYILCFKCVVGLLISTVLSSDGFTAALSAPPKTGTPFLSIFQGKKPPTKQQTNKNQRKHLHYLQPDGVYIFLSFQMNYYFIEIFFSKNEVKLLENIMNNLVNCEKTLKSKFARCCFHLAEESYL